MHQIATTSLASSTLPKAVDAQPPQPHHITALKMFLWLSARDQTSVIKHAPPNRQPYNHPPFSPAVPSCGNGHDEGVGAERDASRRGLRLSNGVHLGQSQHHMTSRTPRRTKQKHNREYIHQTYRHIYAARRKTNIIQTTRLPLYTNAHLHLPRAIYIYKYISIYIDIYLSHEPCVYCGYRRGLYCFEGVTRTKGQKVSALHQTPNSNQPKPKPNREHASLHIDAERRPTSGRGERTNHKTLPMPCAGKI